MARKKSLKHTHLSDMKKMDYCIVSEASSDKLLVIQIRVGEGFLHGKLIMHGKQGHVAYPDLALNPIHCLALLQEWVDMKWDERK